MCRRQLFDREIVQLLENEPPYDSEDDLESGDEQGIYIDDNIIGLEALDKFLENIDDDELDPFLNSINLLDSNLDINIDMGDVECEPDGPSISLPNFISVQPHAKNEIYKTPDLKIKNLRKKPKLDVTTPPFVVKPQPKIKNKKKQKLDISWKREKLSTQNVEFTGNFELSDEILNLNTPYQIFGYFFQDDLIEHIVYETLIYSVQINPNKNFKIISNDVKKYLGVCLLMGLVNISNIRKYWSPNLGNQIIQETMSVNQFEQIRQFIHFNNNNNMLPKGHAGHDRLHKIRPVMETLKKRFVSIPLEEALSIDEQLCSTKARHFLKQYLPMKPHKWGYKFFVLCGVSGFSYNFEMYSGQENNDVNRYSWEPDFGASGNVVVRLCRIIPKNMNYKVYFDNYYTSVPLMVYMKNRQICSLGTVRRNRLNNILLPNEKDFLKKPRGSSDYCLANINNQEVFATCWRDNKVVTLLSTFVEIDPMSKVKRFSKTENKSIEIDCPNIVNVYNKHMGGVDLLDSLLGRQKIKIRSRKWYLRIFYHLLDVTVVNSWLLHKRIIAQKNKTRDNVEKPMTLSAFKEDLAISLCKVGQSINTRGRPSNTIENALIQKSKKPNASKPPNQDLRMDRIDHWPIDAPTRSRCKMPSCNGYTWQACEKCQVGLCVGKGKTCFKKYHTT